MAPGGWLRSFGFPPGGGQDGKLVSGVPFGLAEFRFFFLFYIYLLYQISAIFLLSQVSAEKLFKYK